MTSQTKESLAARISKLNISQIVPNPTRPPRTTTGPGNRQSYQSYNNVGLGHNQITYQQQQPSMFTTHRPQVPPQPTLVNTSYHVQHFRAHSSQQHSSPSISTTTRPSTETNRRSYQSHSNIKSGHHHYHYRVQQPQLPSNKYRPQVPPRPIVYNDFFQVEPSHAQPSQYSSSPAMSASLYKTKSQPALNFIAPIHPQLSGIRTNAHVKPPPPRETPAAPRLAPSSKTSNSYNTVTPLKNLTSEVCCLKCKDFSSVDAHAGRFPSHRVTSLSNLACDLTSPFTSKLDKARAIFTWCYHNIAYDTNAFFSNNVKHKEPEQTLRTGLAVCQGYAELFTLLARQSGLHAMVISGYGIGYSHQPITGGNVPSYKSNHAWNAVQLDNGEWHLIDPCWGAGYVDESRRYKKHFNPKYFTSSPEEFRKKHYPTDQTKQFCRNEISWQEFILRKEGPVIYLGFGDLKFSEESIQPSTLVIPPGRTRFVITTHCKHPKGAVLPKDQYVILLCVDGVTKPFEVDAAGTVWTCDANVTRGEVLVSYVTRVGKRDGKGIGVKEYLSTYLREGSSWTHLCKWTVK